MDEKKFSLVRLLDDISYPVGTAMKANFRKYGRDLDRTFLDEPHVFYRILIELYAGDEESATGFLYLLAGTLEERGGLRLDREEFVRAVKMGDKETIRRVIAAYSRSVGREE